MPLSKNGSQSDGINSTKERKNAMNFAPVYTFGCGQIHYSDHALDEIGSALKLHGQKILMVAGETAFSVAGERVLKSLHGAKLNVCQFTFSGECSRNNAEILTKAAEDFGADIILAVAEENAPIPAKLPQID